MLNAFTEGSGNDFSVFILCKSQNIRSVTVRIIGVADNDGHRFVGIDRIRFGSDRIITAFDILNQSYFDYFRAVRINGDRNFLTFGIFYNRIVIFLERSACDVAVFIGYGLEVIYGVRYGFIGASAKVESAITTRE